LLEQTSPTCLTKLTVKAKMPNAECEGHRSEVTNRVAMPYLVHETAATVESTAHEILDKARLEHTP
jgi:hypothetical protein